MAMSSASILDILECPVCLNTPSATPIFQCVSNGHVVCKDCVCKLGTTCPVCRQKNGFSRCLTAEKLLNEYRRDHSIIAKKTPLPRVQRHCENADRGCKSNYSSAHSIICRYRSVYCPDITCQRIVQLNKLQTEHMKIDHPDVVTKQGNTTMTFRLCVRPDHLTMTTSYKPVKFSQNGFNFFREIQRSEATKTWYFWVYYDGDECDTKNFSAEFELLNDQKEPILTYRDAVVPLDVSLQQVVMDCRCLVLPDEIMKHKVIKNDEFYLLLTVNRR